MTVSLTVYLIVSVRNSVTLKTGLWVVQGHRKWLTVCVTSHVAFIRIFCAEATIVLQSFLLLFNCRTIVFSSFFVEKLTSYHYVCLYTFSVMASR